MTDPTNTNLEYALLDQKIAGAFEHKVYAYVPVTRAEGKPYGAGIAIQNEGGYHPIDGPSVQWDSYAEASEFCRGMNRHIGLTDERAVQIYASSMRRP